jgi:hypothetical protein
VSAGGGAGVGLAPARVEVGGVGSLPHVTQAHMLLGPTDCMAYVECATHAALRDMVMQIRAVPDVLKTDTRYVYG